MGRRRKNKMITAAAMSTTTVTTVGARTLANCATNFKLVIPDDIYQKIAYWLTKTPNEVSGFGSLEWDAKSATFTVKDVILLKQEVGRASTEIDPVAIGKAMYQMKDEPLGMKWHWHTHPNMGVFWSGDDMEVIRSLGQQGWIVATVFNEKGQNKSAFYTKTSVLGQDHDVFKDDLPTEIVRFFPKSFFTALDEEYDKCVSTIASKWVGPGVATKTETTTSEEEWNYYNRTQTPNDTPQVKLTYSNFGYATRPGSNLLIYNPLHDKELETRAQQVAAIDELLDTEIKYLDETDKEFALLFNEYVQKNVEEAQISELEKSWAQ